MLTNDQKYKCSRLIMNILSASAMILLLTQRPKCSDRHAGHVSHVNCMHGKGIGFHYSFQLLQITSRA